MYKIQYLHLFPFNCSTSTRLFCIESISFESFRWISFQYCLMQDFKVFLSSNWCLFLYTLLDKIPYKFSIEFKSGNLVGQSKTSIFFCFLDKFCELRSVFGSFVLLTIHKWEKTFFQHIDISSRVLNHANNTGSCWAHPNEIFSHQKTL